MAKTKSIPTRSKDVPATLGMLHIVRDELKSEIAGMKAKMESEFAKMNSVIHQMRLIAKEQRIESVEKTISQFKR